MAQPKYFRIPRQSLITLPRGFTLSPSGDVYVNFADTRAWSSVDQARGRVVVMDLLPSVGSLGNELEYRTLVAYDGMWVEQLLNWSADNPSFGPIYEYEKRANILNVSQTYQEINRLQRADLPSGVYEITFSTTWRYDSANQQVYFRWSENGGSNWFEFIFDVGASLERTPWFYSYPVVRSEGPVDLVLQARKGAASGTFDISYADITFEKKRD